MGESNEMKKGMAIMSATYPPSGQGDYFFALDISKWKESISKNESSVALRV